MRALTVVRSMRQSFGQIGTCCAPSGSANPLCEHASRLVVEFADTGVDKFTKRATLSVISGRYSAKLMPAARNCV